MNQTAQEGQDATFQCTMKTLDGDFTSGVLIQYVPVNGTADPWLCVLFQCVCRGSCRSGISIQSQRDSSDQFIEYRVEITIPSVAPADSGAVVSCLLLNNNVTQWRGDATLTVVPDTLTATPTASDSDDQGTGQGSDPMLQYIAVPVTVLILIGGVIIVATILYKRRVAVSKRVHENQLGKLLLFISINEPEWSNSQN